jgi:hypothetical protein
MNSHQESLTAVNNEILLQSQQTIYQNKSQMIASMFTFYYAKGAKINAQENLELSNTKIAFQQKIKNAVLKNSSISNDLLNLSQRNAAETNMLVTESSICAANIQIATNAIVKLASDVGSIFSIINASDAGSEIYYLCEEASEYINTTAHQAEILSMEAMELSALAAEITAASNFDLTKKNNDLMNNLLQVVSSEYDSISQTINSDHKKTAVTTTAEKTAEGLLETNYNAFLQAKKTYSFHNKKLNFNLKIPEKERTEAAFTITFDGFKTPFSSLHKDKTNPELNHTDPSIKEYQIMIVKEHKKSFFLLADAETLITKTSQHKTILPSTEALSKENKIQIGINDLLDSDGNKIELGQEYSVFLLAVFTEAYKHKRNVFDNYLSAPSASFKLSHTLICPKPEDIIVSSNTAFNKLSFTLIEYNNIKTKYRCIFLPYRKEMLTTRISNINFQNIEEELQDKITENGNALFNLTIAEQVPAANYSVVEIISKTPEESNSIRITGEVQINEQTTDNFGKYLIPGNKYVPIILAMCSDLEENPNQFTNSLSNYQKTEAFIYPEKQ